MRIIVTGGNSGVGQATATALAAAGHSVVIACRSMDKAHRAAAGMPGDVTVSHLDLADLSSVRRFADSVDSVDVLIDNAGVLGLPLTRTVDGFETHIGTNHLGHFALTCLLGERITDRVVCVASAMYVFGRLDQDDLNWHSRRYWKWAAYTQSKLANMLFVAELARRGMCAYASDPGAADTDITRDSTGVLGWLGRHKPKGRRLFYMQTPAAGARATIEAVDTDLPSGSFLAPRFNQWGAPNHVVPHRKARDPYLASRLWDMSVELTGCDWVGSEERVNT
jgi:NAD(P)-dependent dehydrogenase (short-subunit alcohol dehydrogenase family)